MFLLYSLCFFLCYCSLSHTPYTATLMTLYNPLSLPSLSTLPHPSGRRLPLPLYSPSPLFPSSSPSGSLIQLPSVERGKLSKVRLGSLSLKKEGDRQCFLFTKHFLICTRSSGGKLHLLKVRHICMHIPVNTRMHTETYCGSHLEG